MSTTYAKGKYQAEIIGQGFEESAAKGTPCFFLQLLILMRYGDLGQLMECPRYERTYRQYLANDTGVNILRGQLKSVGVEFTRLEQLEPGAVNHVSLVGRKIERRERGLSEREHRAPVWGRPLRPASLP